MMIIFKNDKINPDDYLELRFIAEWNQKRIIQNWEKPFRIGSINFINDFAPYGYEKGSEPLALADCETRAIIIFLDAYLTNSTIFKNEILTHEICHLAAYQYHGHIGHGKAWREIMQFCGLKCRLYYNIER